MRCGLRDAARALLVTTALLAPTLRAAASSPAPPPASAPAPLPASASASGDGVVRLESAWLEIRDAIPATTPVSDGPQPIRLPLHWDVQFEGVSARLSVRVPLELAAPPSNEPLMLLVERLGAAYEIALNGETIAAAGALEGGDSFYAKYPIYTALPSRLLRAGTNDLVFRLRAEAGYRTGLSPPLVGPASALAVRNQWEQAYRVVLPLAASIFSLFVGGFCLLLWWQQRDRLYAWAGIGELCWAATVADTVLERIPLPWPWWGLVLVILRSGWVWSLYAIAEQVFGRSPERERRALFWVLLSAPLFAFGVSYFGGTRPLVAWYCLVFATWVPAVVRLASQLGWPPRIERAVVWTAMVVVTVASARDVWAARFAVDAFSESAWAKYTAPLVGIGLLAIVAQHFRNARQAVLQMNATLAARVEQKEAELVASFERMAELERTQATLAERQRILRDMHDGVGAHLATAVRQLESGRASGPEVAQALRDSLTQLKLQIDSMALPAGDVNALLASLRYRLEPRIKTAGLSLHWEVEGLPTWRPHSIPSDDAMRQLQYLLLEAISNVLQHAAAKTLTIRARRVDDVASAIEIEVEDDGHGLGAFAGETPRALRERAQTIGALLEVGPVQVDGSGTRVALRLPVDSISS